jgi:flagellar basal-body rod protein FlgG
LQNTGNPFDLALSGPGFFVVRAGDAILYTRDGQFHRDSEGRLVSAEGMVLQSDSGDVSVQADNPEILADGTVLDNGNPVARIKVEDFADLHQLQPALGGAFHAAAGQGQDVAVPQIRQGMLEQANVNTADEMLSVMAALRSAQSGQKLVQVYDDLMGRAITAFGQM